ncbi:MAG: T9SS type A sorting domain-containing protein [Fluviicola sp.]|nr:T9SS type A sorting domain-containing protein [Fluviicola sp.]
MKKTLLIASLAFTTLGMSQTYSDNFDAYNAGQYMAQQSGGFWTTWSNAPGGTEDVLVSSANSVSGPNSVYFATSAQAGGPTDLVRNFGVLNTGQFSMEFNILVETGKAGYFNFQRNATIGQVWAMDCFFNDNGTITINNQSGLNFSGAYTQNTWFNFRIDINFNTNNWEVFIDDVSIGSFSNSENQIASIDIYPTDQNTPYSCGYFIDDFSYTITPYTLPNLNAAVTLVSFDQGEIAGAAVTPKVRVRNLGTTTINSFNLDVDYNGNNLSQSVTGLNLASLAETTITLTANHTLIAGQNDMVATVSNVNGNATDGDADDDAGSISVDPIIPAAGKMVVGEEGTGTWCQWCPRGAVFMDLMETKYPSHWAGIAVHNGDPMTVTDYDAAIGGLIAGYPSSLVDRGADADPSVMETEFLTRILVAPKAFITNGAIWNSATRVLEVSVSAEFQAAATNGYKLAIVLTEDGVTGSGSGWSQSNAYSGGGNGVMGGFETLGNPVPAAQMVYDHVARAIEPSFGGFANSFPATVNAGETHTVNGYFDIPAGWDENEIHIVGLLIAPDGRIDNAGKATITEAVANGFVGGTNVGIAMDDQQLDATLQIYPNPAHDMATVAINLKNESNVSMRVLDLSGKEMAARNYGSMNGAATITMNTSEFVAGVYIVELTLDNEVVQQRLVVE